MHFQILTVEFTKLGRFQDGHLFSCTSVKVQIVSPSIEPWILPQQSKTLLRSLTNQLVVWLGNESMGGGARRAH